MVGKRRKERPVAWMPSAAQVASARRIRDREEGERWGRGSPEEAARGEE
jgi:hypothetical protein